MEPTLSIGQVADRTGLSRHTLRFYESEDLMLSPVRRSGQRRVYSEEDVDWLQVCVILRASGMPLAALRQYTRLVRQGDGTEQERLGLLREHREAVLTQIEELGRCLDVITFKVGVYEDVVEAEPAGTGSPA